MYRNINYQLILHTIGKVLLFECVFMLVAWLLSVYNHGTDMSALLGSLIITMVIGLLLTILNKKSRFDDPDKRESFISVTFSWILLSVCGALPFYFAHATLGFTDALFESVSGFTTTGSSVIPDVESLPKGIIFWRAETHWIGGMGIIVLVIAIMSHYKIGAGHLISAEGSIMGLEKLKPRIIDTAKRLWLIYVILTFTETVLLKIGGLSWYDSICHSFATIATGGFSTKNNSIAGFSAYCQYVIIIFMFLSGVNFALHYFGFHRQYKKVFSNEELRLYTIIIAIIGLIITFSILPIYNNNFEESARHAYFQIVSIITATGFSSADYTKWGSFARLLIFLSMFIGACAGSTGGGIKVARYNIAIKGIGLQFKRLISPNGIHIVRVNGQQLENQAILSVLAFITLYGLTFLVGTFFMAATGLDLASASSSVITTLGGIGPGIGTIGPANTFVDISTVGKLYLSLNMLVGRLEIISFLILFSKSFYRI